MEPALRSFLDGIDENDNVVTIRPANRAPKNDNEEPLQDGSGMLDMREMARRYRQMVDASGAKPEEPAPLLDLRTHILAPVVETASERHPALLIASIATAALLLVTLTGVITVLLMRGSAGAAHDPASMALAVEHAPAAAHTLAAEPMVIDEIMPSDEPVAEREAALQEAALEEAALREAALQEAALQEAALQEAALQEAALAKAALAKAALAKAALAKAEPALSPAPHAVAPLVKTPVAAAKASTTAPATVPVAVEQPEAKAPVLASIKESPESVVEHSASCDEVACLLEGRACCDKVANAAKAKVPSVDQSRPEKLSRSDISEGLAAVQGRLQSCGTKNEMSGAVTIKLQINAEGAVQSSKVGSGSEDFQGCVSQILQKAKFAQTRSGTTVSYPIILR